jgi:hypothetical protein
LLLLEKRPGAWLMFLDICLFQVVLLLLLMLMLLMLPSPEGPRHSQQPRRRGAQPRRLTTEQLPGARGLPGRRGAAVLLRRHHHGFGRLGLGVLR